MCSDNDDDAAFENKEANTTNVSAMNLNSGVHNNNTITIARWYIVVVIFSTYTMHDLFIVSMNTLAMICTL